VEDHSPDRAETDPVASAEQQLEDAEHADDPARLNALSQLHDILETELDRPEEERIEPSYGEDAGDTD
jgi:hypothetical protein